jgi:hypothetical protein
VTIAEESITSTKTEAPTGTVSLRCARGAITRARSSVKSHAEPRRRATREELMVR